MSTVKNNLLCERISTEGDLIQEDVVLKPYETR
jgi:hypothetical protein